MPTLNVTEIRALAVKIFCAAGASTLIAEEVADSLVEANLTGHDSHGIIRIKEYIEAIRHGRIIPGAEPRILEESATTLKVDGGGGFGQVVASRTMARLMEKASVANLAAATILQCGHIGRLGAYVQRAAERGYVAFAFVDGGASEPRVAPYGGCRPVLGTNPIAAAVPSLGLGPIVIDFSTAAAASGKIRLAKSKGQLLPEGWILDRAGSPSRQPKDYYEGGMLLPAAEHKGYGLALLVEVLGGILSGAGSPVLDGWGVATTNGVFLLALKVEAFVPLPHFLSQVARLGDAVKAVPPIKVGGKVLLPGEPEESRRAERLATGIDIDESTWQSVQTLARNAGA